MRKVKIDIRETNRKNKSKNGVSFVVTYHPLLNSIYGIIRKNIFFLAWIKRLEVFNSKPMVSFRSVRKLSVAIWFERSSIIWKEEYCCNCCQVFRSITETDMFIKTPKVLIKSTTALTVM